MTKTDLVKTKELYRAKEINEFTDKNFSDNSEVFKQRYIPNVFLKGDLNEA